MDILTYSPFKSRRFISILIFWDKCDMRFTQICVVHELVLNPSVHIHVQYEIFRMFVYCETQHQCHQTHVCFHISYDDEQVFI